jgi:hypothetical protein
MPNENIRQHIEEMAADQGWSDETLHKMAYEFLLSGTTINAAAFMTHCIEVMEEEEGDDTDDEETEE